MKSVLICAVLCLLGCEVNSLTCYECSNIEDVFSEVNHDCVDNVNGETVRTVVCADDKVCATGRATTDEGDILIYRSCLNADFGKCTTVEVPNHGQQNSCFDYCDVSYCNNKFRSISGTGSL